ncbi:MAG: hypothetical protein AAB597_02450 [Patescibacteria group bacterium]
MLYAFYGNDREGVNRKAGALLSELKKKYKGIEVLSFVGDAFEPQAFFPLMETRGLFEDMRIVVCDGMYEVAELGKKTNLGALQKTPNIFLLKEGLLLSEEVKKLAKYSEKSPEESKVLAKKPDFNIFSLAGALGDKDRKKLWVLLQEAWRAGLSSESIAGTLFWQAKTIAQASRGEDSDLKDFPRQNARHYAKNFKDGEAEKMLGAISDAYHRRGEYGEDFDLALEKFVLSV